MSVAGGGRAARLAGCAGAALLAGCVASPQNTSSAWSNAAPADLVLTHGVVYTVDASRSWAEAVALRDGRIVAVGTDAEVRPLAGPATRVVDLGGRFVMPAFHDAHVHPVSAGVELGQCNLNDLDTADATVAAVAACVPAQAGRSWLVGGGWSLTADPAQDASQVAAFVRTRAATTERGVVAGTVKIFVDGVIEAATAALVEPYLPMPSDRRTGAPATRGLPNYTDAQLQALVTQLDREGFQAHLHAIGDGAVRQGLDAVAAADRANGHRDRRAHIAHLELVQPDDVPRFRQLGVIANLQPLWAYHDTYIRDLTEPRLGPLRSRWLYPFGALHRAGAMLAGGSDWSVSSVNPLDAIQVAVTRLALTAPAGTPAWLPDERLDVPTALAAYTIGGAYVSFEERDSGSLEVGKFADLIVLDQKLFALAPERIHDVRVQWTLLEGREVYRAPGFTP